MPHQNHEVAVQAPRLDKGTFQKTQDSYCPPITLILGVEVAHDILEHQMRDNVKARINNEAQDNPYRESNSSRMVQSQVELYKYYQKK